MRSGGGGRVRVGIAVLLLALEPAHALAQLRAERVAGGFSLPLAFVQDPSDSRVQVVVQQGGRIRVLVSGAIQSTDYLDLRSVVRSGGEQGLLGLAFAPDYATSGRVFVNFTNLSGDTVVARFKRSSTNPLQADASTRFDLRWPDGQRFITQPFDNHQGGNLVFGPDGFLYIGMGDGGSGNDPGHRAQNPGTLLGKMLRIDVRVPDSDPEGYDVPSSNPFVGQGGVLGEIWSFGLRNPWRYSFDSPQRGGTGALVIGDVGQNAWEEIDYEPAGRGGRNYGWRNREGAHNHVTSLPPFSQPLIDPIHEYSHSVGGSVTGGFVYRGTALGPTARGRYFFADFVSSRVWSIRLAVSPTTGEATASDLIEHTASLGSEAVANPASFGEDSSGELYLVSYSGAVYRLRDDSVVGGGGFGKRRPATLAPSGFAVPRVRGAAPRTSAVTAPKPEVVRTTAVDPCASLMAWLEALDELVPVTPDRVRVVIFWMRDSGEETDAGARPALFSCLLKRIGGG
jgi:glucose/arabinose dehydrogenase